MSMKLTVVRHGETTANRDKITQGQLDTELTDQGRQQAIECAAVLAHEEIDAIVSSDLKRCVDTTARIALHHANVPLRFDSRFREYSFGDQQGKPTHAWDWPDAVDGTDMDASAPGGESSRQVAERIVASINELYEEYENKHVLVVAHGGVIRLLRVLTGEIEFRDRMRDKIGNCSAWRFDIAAPLSELGAVRQSNGKL